MRESLAALSKKQWKHPITDKTVSFAFSTIERWLYQVRKQNNPVAALRPKLREDAGKPRQLSVALKQALTQQYRQHPGWSYQLHVDNLAVLVTQQSPVLGTTIPSYSTVLRYMKSHNLKKQRRAHKRDTQGAAIAAMRLENREVRGYEVDHINALWHLDFLTKVYVEISTQEIILQKPEKRKIIHPYGELLYGEVYTYPLEEILAEKIRALLQFAKKLHERGWGRSRVRDYYDLWRVLKSYSSDLHLDILPDLVRQKCIHKDIVFGGIADIFQNKLMVNLGQEWESWLSDMVTNLPRESDLIDDLKEILTPIFKRD